MLKLILRFILTICLTASAYPGTIAGNIQTASGGAVVGGTLTFTLSQSAIVSGTATLVSAPVSCYTSTSGAIVGLPDPTALPVISANLGSGTLASGTYFVKITYYNASGETLASPETSFFLAGVGTLIVNAPVSQPSNATGYKVYISSATGTETLQATQSSFVNYNQASALSAGSALPSTNTSTCSIRFSDELIPSGTSYAVNLTNKNGAQMAGYPQTWYTYGGSGATINVSNGAPQGGGAVIYPTPIFANPNGNAQQSIAGPLTLGGYAFAAGSVAINGGSAITGQTGTGGTVVMSASPTLTGSPALGTPTATSIALGGGTPLATTNQSGSGSLCMTSGCAMIAPQLQQPTVTKVSPTLVNGANNNVTIGVGTFITITGPTGVFNITGFTAGADGQPLFVFNTAAFAMTISNENAGSTAANRITTLTGADVTLRAGQSFATFIYNGAASRWILASTN